MRKPRRRWLAFSLRTLFVLMTVLGCLSGWIVYQYRIVRMRQEAMKALRTRGFEVEVAQIPPALLARLLARFSGQDPIGPVESIRGWDFSDSDMSDVLQFPELRYLGIFSGTVTDAGLARLDDLPALEYLCLKSLPISDAGLAPIRRLNRLTAVELCCEGITDQGLVNIRHLQGLTWLYIQSPAVTDAGLVHIEGLDRITKLDLQGTQVSDRGLPRLRRLPLSELLLGGTQVTDAGLKHLAAIPSLTQLTLNDTALSDAGLDEVRAFDNLIYLAADRTKVTAEGVRRLHDERSNLNVSSSFEWAPRIPERPQ